MKTEAEWMCEWMCDNSAELVIEYAQYMVDNRCSLRRLAKDFCIPYTTMHKYITHDIKHLDDDLYIQCKNILKNNRKNQKRDRKGRFV